MDTHAPDSGGDRVTLQDAKSEPSATGSVFAGDLNSLPEMFVKQGGLVPGGRWPPGLFPTK